MIRAIVYVSCTGHTKQYAELLQHGGNMVSAENSSEILHWYEHR